MEMEEAEAIKVLLVDDHEMVGSDLLRCLAPRMGLKL